MTQCQRIMAHLTMYGEITAAEAMDRYGVARLAARIAELREKGNDIKTIKRKSKNRYGRMVTYGVYTL